MLSSVFIAIISAVSLAASAPALQARQLYTVTQSAPFNLIVESSNSTLNGSQLFAGHSGAAIEELIVGSKTISQSSSSQFNFNVSSTTYQQYSNITGQQGSLVWTLPASNINVSEPLQFLYNPAYNTAVMQFAPSAGAIFGFKNDYLVVAHYTDATPAVVALERWYTCMIPLAQGNGYNYHALAWGLGSKTPDNDSCQSVRVKRVFV